MFDIASTELLLVVIVAVVVIGPKDLPRALYKVGQVVGKARAMSRHFRSGLDTMMREVEMEEMEKKWAAENRRIMQQYPNADSEPAPAETTALASSDVLEAPVAQPSGASTDEDRGDKQASLPLGDQPVSGKPLKGEGA